MRRLSRTFTNKQLLTSFAWLLLSSFLCAVGRVIYADHQMLGGVINSAGWIVAWIAGLHYGEVRAANRIEAEKMHAIKEAYARGEPIEILTPDGWRLIEWIPAWLKPSDHYRIKDAL